MPGRPEPHPARVYDYWLGGKDNFTVDRELGDALKARGYPAVYGARANRAYLGRVVRFLIKDAGISQFLDIGPGLPSPGNTREILDELAPHARVAYVDRDPIVLAHARARLNLAAGLVDYIEADVRDTGTILAGARRTLDLSQPVAVLMIAVLHYLPDIDAARDAVSGLLAGLPSGSYLAHSDLASDSGNNKVSDGIERVNRSYDEQLYPRPSAELASLHDGLELVEPGFVNITAWRPDDGAGLPPGVIVPVFGGVSRKRG
jgi:SAM-dependent methyltransferase